MSGSIPAQSETQIMMLVEINQLDSGKSDKLLKGSDCWATGENRWHRFINHNVEVDQNQAAVFYNGLLVTGRGGQFFIIKPCLNTR
ncbi:hypothetical protein [Parasphaerochaeta coccoides]|uniref:Uncharacterized protein n=1 Tax=Parasphaerochaeta coccoides (strain ATCC BAA-1237 / DSM 17374 / SPN1) TaxID=760011 RepID=F4GHV0_PARC1|nr:hypothetical protein [Parasphaerochaeta coccoides]AEC02063.1 hypothetical protein Spico_0839 [Parasphaerochaeta coccoides DSM 17374]